MIENQKNDLQALKALPRTRSPKCKAEAQQGQPFTVQYCMLQHARNRNVRELNMAQMHSQSLFAKPHPLVPPIASLRVVRAQTYNSSSSPEPHMHLRPPSSASPVSNEDEPWFSPLEVGT